MDTKEAGSKGGKKSWAGLSPEQRSARARANALSGTAEQRRARAKKANRASVKSRRAALVELPKEPEANSA